MTDVMEPSVLGVNISAQKECSGFLRGGFVCVGGGGLLV